MIKGVGHIGLAVKDIDKIVTALCAALSIPRPEIKDVPEKKMKVAVINVGAFGLEILEDYSEDGPFARFVQERGNAIHHFCLISDDIVADIETLEKRGVEMTDRTPKLGLRGKRIAFAAPDLLDGISIELSEP